MPDDPVLAPAPNSSPNPNPNPNPNRNPNPDPEPNPNPNPKLAVPQAPLPMSPPPPGAAPSLTPSLASPPAHCLAASVPAVDTSHAQRLSACDCTRGASPPRSAASERIAELVRSRESSPLPTRSPGSTSGGTPGSCRRTSSSLATDCSMPPYRSPAAYRSPPAIRPPSSNPNPNPNPNPDPSAFLSCRSAYGEDVAPPLGASGEPRAAGGLKRAATFTNVLRNPEPNPSHNSLRGRGVRSDEGGGTAGPNPNPNPEPGDTADYWAEQAPERSLPAPDHSRRPLAPTACPSVMFVTPLSVAPSSVTPVSVAPVSVTPSRGRVARSRSTPCVFPGCGARRGIPNPNPSPSPKPNPNPNPYPNPNPNPQPTGLE